MRKFGRTDGEYAGVGGVRFWIIEFERLILITRNIAV
jgi:hypothetical protein